MLGNGQSLQKVVSLSPSDEAHVQTSSAVRTLSFLFVEVSRGSLLSELIPEVFDPSITHARGYHNNGQSPPGSLRLIWKPKVSK